MKRVFLTGALTLTILSALAVLLAVQAQDSRRSKQPTIQDSQRSLDVDKSTVSEMDKPAVQPSAVSAIRPSPDYDPAKDPRRPGYRMTKEARELLRAGDLDAAERKCREALQFFRTTYMASLPKGLQSDASYLADETKELLGDIQLAKGQYKESLERYKEVTENFSVARSQISYDMLLNVALCYIRLGDYASAKKFYSDEILLNFTGVSREDLPGTDTPRALEASILLARGAEAETSADAKGALANYEPASKLAPRNGMLAYHQATVLMDLKLYDEALPMFARAVRFGNPAQIKSAKSTMIQRWPRAQAEAAIREAAKIP